MKITSLIIRRLGFVYIVWKISVKKYKTCLGYVPISSSAPLPLGAAYVPILLREVELEQRPSGNGVHEAIVVGAALCDGEGDREYTAYAPLYNIFASRTNVFSFLEDVSATLCCRNVRRHIVAETSVTETSRIPLKGLENGVKNFDAVEICFKK